MNWLYTISATSGPRLLMRVAMVFDQQQLTLSALDCRCDHAASLTSMSIGVRCEEALARRIHAKLLHLQDVFEVQLAHDEESAENAETPLAQINLPAISSSGVCEAC